MIDRKKIKLVEKQDRVILQSSNRIGRGAGIAMLYVFSDYFEKVKDNPHIVFTEDHDLENRYPFFYEVYPQGTDEKLYIGPACFYDDNKKQLFTVKILEYDKKTIEITKSYVSDTSPNIQINICQSIAVPTNKMFRCQFFKNKYTEEPYDLIVFPDGEGFVIRNRWKIT